MQTYFVNPNSAGGDGTTNALSGATAAFASLEAARQALSGTDWTLEASSVVSVYGADFDVALRIILDMGNPRADDTTSVNLGGWQLDATHKLLIQAADGSTIAGQTTTDSRHKGVFGAGYRFIGSRNGSFIEVNEAHVIYVDAEAENTRASSGFVRAWGSASVGPAWLINCLGTGADTGFEYGQGSILVNCIAVSPGGVGIAGPGATSDNARLYNCASVDAGGNGFTARVGASAHAKNCWGFGSTGADFEADFDANSHHNASEDTSAPGANAQTGLVSTAGTDFVDYPNADYAPASGGKLDSTGVDLSADTDFAFDFDIKGATRAQWDIGPFAVASTPSVAPSPSGVAATAQAGTVTVEATGNATASPTGVSSSATAEELGSSSTAVEASEGVESTAQVGTLAAQPATIAKPSGVAGIGQAGDASVSTSGAVLASATGVESTSAAGSLGVAASTIVVLAGVQAASAVGTATAVVSGDAAVTLTGVEAEARVGTILLPWAGGGGDGRRLSLGMGLGLD